MERTGRPRRAVSTPASAPAPRTIPPAAVLPALAAAPAACPLPEAPAGLRVAAKGARSRPPSVPSREPASPRVAGGPWKSPFPPVARGPPLMQPAYFTTKQAAAATRTFDRAVAASTDHLCAALRSSIYTGETEEDRMRRRAPSIGCRKRPVSRAASLPLNVRLAMKSTAHR
ncbi:hypothetical protein DIPPA_33482 [Diplonema papillatum]|nr:hypothetical protein DIPPA_33482 [Diplonema papillatum]